MNLFEDTRRSLDGAFKRISDIGGKEVMVFSFIDFLDDNKESFTLKEAASPYKQWRDATIKPSNYTFVPDWAELNLNLKDEGVRLYMLPDSEARGFFGH